MFCRAYATDPLILGNATEAYKIVYGVSHIAAKMASCKLMASPRIIAKINEYIEKQGFNNENVDKQHLFLINQHKDLNVKMKGIEHYNKLKKRISDRVELVIPKPIMELEEDEVIHKIDKGKARDVSDLQ